MRSVSKVAAAVATALLLAACGGNGDGGGTEGGGGEGVEPEGGGATTLTMIDNAFQPSSLTVSAGTELKLLNDGQTVHNVTIEGTDVAQDVESGATGTVAIDAEAGDYTMFCEYHRALGMEGVITVQ